MEPRSPSPAPTQTARFRYHGTGSELFGIVLVNGLLTFLTLGIYSFWAKNKVRVYHYSQTEMDGDRFAYHGTGGELFSGAIKAFGIILVMGIALAAAGFALNVDNSPGMQALLNLAFYIAFGLLVAFAVNNARRYRLSRSSWRGIRMSFHGDSSEFVKLIIKGTLLSIITLGFYTPFFQNERRAFLVRNAKFGSEPFMYDGDARELFGQFIKAVLLTIPTFGIYWYWYSAFKHRYFWNHTKMRGARFRSSVTGDELLVLQLSNFFLVFLTLGIAAPWAMVRIQEFWCDNLALHGTMDWARIRQEAQEAAATGEGIADGMDVDIGIGM